MKAKTLSILVLPSMLVALALWVGNAQATCSGGAENGVEDPGEDCDDGPDSLCCRSDCTIDALKKGSGCEDHNDCSNNSKCDAAGHCGGGTANNGISCTRKNLLGQRTDCTHYTCVSKACNGNPTNDCDDGVECTADNCDLSALPTASAVCFPTHPALTNNENCDADNNACTVDRCNAMGVCIYSTSISCDPQPSNVCREKVCNANTGGCVTQDKVNGMACTDDGKQCTDDDCNNGNCRHFGRDFQSCNDGNACTAGEYCNTSDQCVNGSIQVGLPCNDNNICTSASSCNSSGACAGTTCVGSGTCTSSGCGSTACNSTLPNCNCFAGTGG